MSMINGLVGKLRYFSIRAGSSSSARVMNEAADVLEELSAKLSAANMERSTAYYNGGWIACSDRQPDKDGYFLITTSDFEIDVREYCFSNGWGWDSFKRIIAWQPLPEVYKGE